MREQIERFLKERGYNLDDENFRNTGVRFEKVLDEKVRPVDFVINEAKSVLSVRFKSRYGGIILVRDVDVFSLCPHHLLPVIMKVHFVYIPNGEVVGISKIPRFLKVIGTALFLQEDYTEVVLDVFQDEVKPQGSMIVVRGEHSCMRLRGVMQSSVVETMGVRGIFEDPGVKMEVVQRLNFYGGK